MMKAMHGVINLVYQFSLKLYKMTITKQTETTHSLQPAVKGKTTHSLQPAVKGKITNLLQPAVKGKITNSLQPAVMRYCAALRIQ